MRINTNILSLMAQRRIGDNTRAYARSLERLASGSRINHAGDDAASLAIGERLQSYIRPFAQIQIGINRAMGLLQTADSALQTQMDLIQRMRELCLQSSNGLLGGKERSYLQTEFDQLLDEYNRINQETQFGDRHLLDGSFDGAEIQVGEYKGQNLDLGFSPTSIEAYDQSLQNIETFSLDQTLTAKASQIKVVDLNDDGIEDVFAGGQASNDNSYAYFGNGDGTFSSATTYNFKRANYVTFADYNGDGHTDIVTADVNLDEVKIFLGSASGSFTQSFTMNFTNLGEIQAGDINGDGFQDIIIKDGQSILLALGNGDGSFQAAITLRTVAGTLSNISIGDFNKDGRDDVLSADIILGTAEIDRYDGAAYVEDTINSASENNKMTIADLDNDGDLDIFGTGVVGGGRYQTFMNDGSGQLIASTSTLAHNINTNRVLEDFDGDGLIDVISNNVGDNALELYRNNGDGSFSSPIVHSGSLSTTLQAASDLNGDGFADLIYKSGSNIDLYMQDTNLITTKRELSIRNAQSARNLLEVLDDSYDQLLSLRASIGAQQNQLSSALSTVFTTQENLTSARSQILDTDYAQETAELARTQILQQAGISVLSQANVSLQIVLDLLKF